LSFNGNQYPDFAEKVISTRGDIIRGNSSGERARYGIGAANTVLTSDGTDPAWAAHGGVPTTTKGDISGFSTTQARIPISTNNYSLFADSAQALGLKWAASPTSTLTTTGDLLAASAANVLTRIAGGASGEILTGNGAGVLPTFQAAAGGGGAWSFVESFTLSSNASSWTITPSTAMDLEAYEEFIIKIMLEPIAPEGDLSVQLNGNTTAAYMVEAVDVDEFTVSGLSSDSQNESTLLTACPPTRALRLEISWIYSPAGGDTQQNGRFYISCGDQKISQGHFALADVLTEISELKITMSAGTIKAIGATAKLYRLSLS